MAKALTEYARLAKAANERMRQLEKRSTSSPAYQGVQARLEQIGVKAGSATGRRFPEAPKKGWNAEQMRQFEKEVKSFLNHKTSTVRGFKDFKRQIYETSDARYGLSEKGISPDDWFDVWRNIEQKEKAAMIGTDIAVAIIKAYGKKKQEGEEDGIYSWKEVSDIIKSAKDEKAALDELGLSWQVVGPVEIPFE